MLNKCKAFFLENITAAAIGMACVNGTDYRPYMDI